MLSEKNLIIGTPAYSGMVHTDYVHSLLGFSRCGIPFGLLSIGNESLITRARNSILARFYHSPEYTHLLFLDGDVMLEAKDLIRLIEHDKDVIGAPVPLKTTDNGKPVFNINGNLGQEQGLLKVEQLGTAVMMLSRKAVNALVQQAIAENNVYTANPYAKGLGDPEKIYDVFRVGVRSAEYLSEDYWVCSQLLDLDFNVYVDLKIRTRHNGMHSF